MEKVNSYETIPFMTILCEIPSEGIYIELCANWDSSKKEYYAPYINFECDNYHDCWYSEDYIRAVYNYIVRGGDEQQLTKQGVEKEEMDQTIEDLGPYIFPLFSVIKDAGKHGLIKGLIRDDVEFSDSYIHNLISKLDGQLLEMEKQIQNLKSMRDRLLE